MKRDLSYYKRLILKDIVFLLIFSVVSFVGVFFIGGSDGIASHFLLIFLSLVFSLLFANKRIFGIVSIGVAFVMGRSFYIERNIFSFLFLMFSIFYVIHSLMLLFHTFKKQK